ncbi:hypothetical protein ACJMK2_035250 [Sinanodonta woodiana]|uniref:Cadherin domain-containing protein n=1 Tax=Sinanodonta woodiana TaxID=1069815 RepID=A0ABD3WXR9_SINWO
MEANDTDQTNVMNFAATDTETATYVNIQQFGYTSLATANVTVKTPLDRETHEEGITLKFTLNDSRGNKIDRNVRVYLLDVCDEVPYFDKPAYTFDIHESSFWKEKYNKTFSIDPQSGHIILLQDLDYEENSFYQFTLHARDGCYPNETLADLTINVQDVQDKPPFFIGLPYMTNLIEENYILLQVSAFDGDRGIPNMVEYSLPKSINCSQNDSDCHFCDRLFEINKMTGNITVTGFVDWSMFDVTQIFGICTITVKASEIDQHPKRQRGTTTTYTNVIITIVDTNNHVPHFNNRSYDAAIQENAAKDTLLLINGGATGITVCDLDHDEYSTFNVTIICSNESYCDAFEVVPSTLVREGDIAIRYNNKTILDYENNPNTTLRIQASEKTNKSRQDIAKLTIQITNVNEFSPQFTNETYEVSFLEQPDNATSVANITATDEDGGFFGKVNYSIAGGNNLFSVNKTTGEIFTNCKPEDLDREKLERLYLSIFAKDGGGLINQTQLIVNLLDRNDNAPKFQQKVYTAFLYENSEEDLKRPFITVQATDRDQNGNPNSLISYEILNVTDLERNFTIDKQTGNIRLAALLDYEALNNSLNGMIIVTVFAYDNGSPPMNGSAIVNITVQVSFILISFHSNKQLAEAGEDTQRTFVKAVCATDADATDRNRHIFYAIATGAFDNFSINSSTGAVSVQTGARFDRDKIGLYNMSIIAIDQGENPHTAKTILRVRITDVNNKPPYFINNSYSVEICENHDNTSAIITCDGKDPDENYSLSYSIIGIKGWNENGKTVEESLIHTYFRIDENGSVFVNSTLDRETVEKLEVILSVNDTKTEDNHLSQTATATLTVTLKDVNDNYPDFNFDGNATYYITRVSENADDPTILMSVSATDKDKNRTIHYNISNSTLNNSVFHIDAITGVLSKNGAVDREITPTVNLTVIATDNGYPPKQKSASVLIIIVDFNDNTPQFCTHSLIYYVMENSTNNTNVATLNATDADDGPNKILRYQIETTEKVPFAINESTGVISTSDLLDREGSQGQSFMLTIVAKDNPEDNKLVRMNTTTITIKLLDINDNPPQFPNQTLTTQLPRNRAVNNTIFTVIATDADASENANVTFSIANDTNASNYFDILNKGKNEGNIIVSQSLINLVGWHNITLFATDNGQPRLSSSKTLYIEILDVNLNAPEIGKAPEKIKVYECARTNFEILKINATDNDKSSPNNEYHFSLSVIQPKNNTSFRINKDTGSVFVNANLSVANTSIYEVQIMATDLGSPNRTSSPVIINIEVSDVNDQPPSFTESNYNFSVQEGKENEKIGQVVAIDPDINSLSCFTFNDIGSYADYFHITDKGYVILKKALDRENKTYDQCGNYPLQWNSTDTTNVRINVLDADDNPPQFITDVLRVGMRRNTEPNKEILQLKSKVTDKDLPENGIDKWIFQMISFNMTEDLNKLLSNQTSGKGCASMICVTGNGTVVNNMWYTQDMSGIFNLNVLVKDGAGNSTVYIKIFLIADSQVLKMTLLGDRTTVAMTKDTILSACSDVTGKLFIYDNIEDHITDAGKVESTKTDLFFHIAEYENNRVLTADEAKRFLDAHADDLYSVRFKNSIISIEVSTQLIELQFFSVKLTTKTTYVLAAVIGLLALVILIVGYMFFSSSNRYKRKLRAAMPMEKEMNTLKDNFAVPGSNMYANRENPLLKAEPAPPGYDEIDSTSLNSLDENEIDYTKREIPREELEEREVTMDMYGEDYNSLPTIDPLEAALREHDAQKQAAMYKQGVSTVQVNHGFVHNWELETTEI